MAHFDAEDFVSWSEKDIRDSFLSMTKENYVAIITFYKSNIIPAASKDTAQKKALSELQNHGILLSFQLPQTMSFEEQERLDKLHMHAMELESKERIELAKITQLQHANRTDSVDNKTFNVSKCVSLLPKFNEDEIEDFFLTFERQSRQLSWPQDKLTVILQASLSGKSQSIMNHMSDDDVSDYEKVKNAILRAHEKVPETYRHNFRSMSKRHDQSFADFAYMQERCFNQWIYSLGVGTDFTKLREAILLEQFKDNLSTEIRIYIDERNAQSVSEAAKLADQFALIHKSATKGSGRSFKSRPTYSSSHNDEHKKFSENKVDKEVKDDNAIEQSKSDSFCKYCKKHNHTIDNCFKLKRKQEIDNKDDSDDTKPVGFLLTTNKPISGFDNDLELQSSSKISSSLTDDPSTGIFKPFIHDGFVSLTMDGTHVPIKILRDTGASQSLLRAGVLPVNDFSYSGNNVLIKGVCSKELLSLPLHAIHLSSDLVSGEVVVAIQDSLPIEGVELLLGNDLAGDKVSVHPIVSNTPSLETDENEDVIPGLYPSCAVTRSMNRIPSKNNDSSFKSHHSLTHSCPDNKNDLNDTDADSSDDVYGLRKLFDDLSGICENTYTHPAHNNSNHLSQHLPQNTNESRFVDDFVKNQADKSTDIAHLFQRAITHENAEAESTCYYMSNGLLMRKWRNPVVSADEEWSTYHQIVVPPQYRSAILRLAHDHPLSGHLGINKTYSRVSQHYFWPKLKKDVQQYCRSCETCQVIGKPNQVIPKAHLKPIPAVEEPFKRILIDCVGPLPRSRSGKEYLLTVMCASTRYPEAFPLSNIRTKTIVNALTKFFTTYGYPDVIQSDQGSNFTSKLFKEVVKELQVKHCQSSAYHPESQGALERFHQTLKTMLKMYCHDTGKSWDDGVHLVIFAAREVVQDSLGFSPFQLVFGHSVRGPLKLLKDKLQQEGTTSKNVIKYVTDMNEKLLRVRELAQQHLLKSQDAMKERYDVDALKRDFKPGDKVLVLLPMEKQPWTAKFQGPYEILKRKSDLNYIIKTPDRRKQTQLCHINMLKLFVSREQNPIDKDIDVVNYVHADIISEHEGPVCIPVKLGNSVVLENLDEKLSHIKDSVKSELKDLILEFSELFPDVPSRTIAGVHDVDVGEAQSIKQHPYRLSPDKLKYLDEEVTYLLKNDLIEKSNSNWSSPCLLVPKPDGSYRMCTDYRKLNAVTKTDTYPIPRIDDCIDSVGNAQVVSKFDLLKGFWQVPLTDNAKELSAFVTPKGLFQYKVMPFGMKNSPATFQRIINDVIGDVPHCSAYIDDIIVYTDNWDQHMETMRLLFEKLLHAKLTVNLNKCEFGHARVQFLGHVVGHGVVTPVEAKVKAICDFPQPKNQKELMRFLGMAGYYRKFCPNFSTVAEPLTRLLSKSKKYEWSSSADDSFQGLKGMLASSPVLAAPQFDKPFKLAVDASDVACGGVLLQEDTQDVDHPVCYFSKKFNVSQRRYSTIEKECLALILSLQHFEVYLSNTLPLVVYSDHNPLIFIDRVRFKNHRLARWSLFLQSYNLQIRHIKGRDNVIADCLSRCA